MKCSDVREKLSLYIDGLLDKQDLNSLDAHLGECASCRGELAALKTLVLATAEIEHIEPPASLRQEILQAVRKEEPSSSVCAQVSDLLSAYLDHELPPSQQGLVMTHLHACPTCAHELAALKSILSTTNTIEMLEPPADLKYRVEKATYGARRRQRIPVGLWFRHAITPPALRWASGAAAASIIGVMILAGIHTQQQPAKRKADANEPVVVTVKPAVPRVQPAAAVPEPKHIDRPMVVADAPVHRTFTYDGSEPAVERQPMQSRRHKVARERLVAMAASTRTIKSNAAKPRVLSSKNKTDRNDADLNYDIDPALDAQGTQAMAAATRPETADSADQDARPKLIELASARAEGIKVSESSSDDWSKKLKAEAAMHKTDNRNGSIRIINARF